MKIAIVQLNTKIGAISQNIEKIKGYVQDAALKKADLIVFPEMSLLGYPPRDLLERPGVLKRLDQALEEIKVLSTQYPNLGIIVGSVSRKSDRSIPGPALHNSVYLICDGEEVFRQDKVLLPEYDIFDDMRYFAAGNGTSAYEFKGESLGILVCEDAWYGAENARIAARYLYNPVDPLIKEGTSILINVSASPFEYGKTGIRYRLFQGHAKAANCPYIYVNQVGGNDELIFDGQSFVLNSKGQMVMELPAFKEDMRIFDTDDCDDEIPLKEDDISMIHDALVLGVRDYVQKSGFQKVILGLSGGIDSAVTCILAVDALGKDNVLGVTMPSKYSSNGSVSDSITLAKTLGIECKEISIKEIHSQFQDQLNNIFQNEDLGVTDENVQSRIRGDLLMAIANQTGALVLSTGNKSEVAVGYCTLYGDMLGALAVLADLYKTQVYQLAGYINRDQERIPRSTIEKVPSAELRPNQKDQDSLPEYEVLDQILAFIIEGRCSISDIVKKGFEKDMVTKLSRLVENNEFKRQQAAPVLKVSSKAFGSGRRFLISQELEEE